MSLTTFKGVTDGRKFRKPAFFLSVWQPFAENWGGGTTSSSDGQNFRAGGRAESTGHINPKHGSEPGRTFYTHISDQYASFSAKVVNVGLRDSTYVLDRLRYHESDLRIDSWRY